MLNLPQFPRCLSSTPSSNGNLFMQRKTSLNVFTFSAIFIIKKKLERFFAVFLLSKANTKEDIGLRTDLNRKSHYDWHKLVKFTRIKQYSWDISAVCQSHVIMFNVHAHCIRINEDNNRITSMEKRKTQTLQQKSDFSTYLYIFSW